MICNWYMLIMTQPTQKAMCTAGRTSVARGAVFAAFAIAAILIAVLVFIWGKSDLSHNVGCGYGGEGRARTRTAGGSSSDVVVKSFCKQP